MHIRDEHEGDVAAIRDVVTEAFAKAPHSEGTEADIIDSLRRADVLSLSLIVENAGEIIGHAAFSPVMIDGAFRGWFGLGPLSVAPAQQSIGIGSQLVKAGLDRLRDLGFAGCVVVGEPAYYGRFGFRAEPSLVLPNVPPEYFQALCWQPPVPAGTVTYHPAFGMD